MKLSLHLKMVTVTALCALLTPTLPAVGNTIPQAVYSDQDYITVSVSDSRLSDMYEISLDVRSSKFTQPGAVDWIGYVIRLDGDEIQSLEDYLDKASWPWETQFVQSCN
jgi:hypothetical protein